MFKTDNEDKTAIINLFYELLSENEDDHPFLEPFVSKLKELFPNSEILDNDSGVFFYNNKKFLANMTNLYDSSKGYSFKSLNEMMRVFGRLNLAYYCFEIEASDIFDFELDKKELAYNDNLQLVDRIQEYPIKTKMVTIGVSGDTYIICALDEESKTYIVKISQTQSLSLIKQTEYVNTLIEYFNPDVVSFNLNDFSLLDQFVATDNRKFVAYNLSSAFDHKALFKTVCFLSMIERGDVIIPRGSEDSILWTDLLLEEIKSSSVRFTHKSVSQINCSDFLLALYLAIDALSLN